MRIGHNPHKDKQILKSDFFHQIVIPVYIPNQEGYYKDSFEILKLCLISLLKTSHEKTYITVVNNGSCQLIIDYLNELYRENKIQELIHVTNIGYINAMLKGIAGQNFDLITTADADVLFLEGWQQATYDVFQSFSKTGAVCPTPSSRSLRTYTANLYWDFFFSKKIKFKTVGNPGAMKKFGLSVGNSNFYNKSHLKKYLTISNNQHTAVIGAGHFVVTYRADIFNSLDKRFTEYILGGDSDNLFDIPVIKKDFWRLSTAENYAYHMGNTLEDWMKSESEKIANLKTIDSISLKGKPNNSKVLYFIKNRLFAKIILNRKVMRYFLIWKGLSKSEAKEYLV